MSRRSATALLVAGVIVPAAAVATPPSAARTAVSAATTPAAAVAVDWQRIALRTIFTEGATPPQTGVLYLAFTSGAVHDAARAALREGGSAPAAVATAAHDVLVEYYPLSAPGLLTDLTNSLASVPDGPAEDQGVEIGRQAAARMIDSRVGDGRNDSTRVYSRADGVGVWQPPTGSPMATAWLGFVDPPVRIKPVPLDGPDPVTSARYATDYEEVRALGSAGSTARTADQTLTARFFAFNPPVMYRTALCDLLTSRPMGLRATTRLFAEIDNSVATAMIRTFRLKYDVGFWRPFQAINDLREDGNPTTTPEPGWQPLIANPAYSDYTSGHAAATAPFAHVMRRTFGDDVTLRLTNPLLPVASDRTREYTTLSALEHDALHARIWGGLHFRDAMADGYRLGHQTAQRVLVAMQ